MPSLNKTTDLPAGTVTVVPVGVALLPFEITTELDSVLAIRYCFSIAGTNSV